MDLHCRKVCMRHQASGASNLPAQASACGAVTALGVSAVSLSCSDVRSFAMSSQYAQPEEHAAEPPAVCMQVAASTERGIIAGSPGSTGRSPR